MQRCAEPDDRSSKSVPARIDYLDGLRGVAIVSVLLYHAYARWAPDQSSLSRLFGWGWLGVELFFIISGFVIFLTLDRCVSFGQFMGKRWLRLFPAMLIASVAIFLTAPLIDRPFGPPSLMQLIPGLTFIDDKWLTPFGGPKSLEGSFWSLYVEMKFYVFVGLAYFTLGRSRAIFGLLGAFALYWACPPLHLEGPRFLLSMLGVPYWAWFACGALFYEGTRSGNQRHFLAALATGAVASALPVPGVGSAHGMLFWPLLGFPFVLLFGAALTSPSIQRVLASRILVFVGFVSYPLYLIHEQLLIGMSRQLGQWMPVAPSFLLPILPVAVLMLGAWFIARYLEPIVRDAIRGFAGRARSGEGAAAFAKTNAPS